LGLRCERIVEVVSCDEFHGHTVVEWVVRSP
jgi:hypothetical protein